MLFVLYRTDQVVDSKPEKLVGISAFNNRGMMRKMNTWPDDVLLIHYKELASNARQRLLLLRLIGTLFHRSSGSYDVEALGLYNNEWSLLSNWIEQGNAASFWHARSQTLIVEQQCDKHVLISTGQLIEDMNAVEKQGMSCFTLDDMWGVARYWVADVFMEDRKL